MSNQNGDLAGRKVKLMGGIKKESLLLFVK